MNTSSPAAPAASATSPGRLVGRVAIVTGAAQGIGAAIAARFVREGARVTLVDRDGPGVEAVAAALGDAALAITRDVTEADAATQVVERCRERFGAVDVLVNNAGVVHGSDPLELGLADFERVLAINLVAPFSFAQAAARAMRDQGRGGAIINMSSINAVLALPDQLPYAVSKGGIAQLTRVLAVALADHGIRVNAIGPGTIATEMAKNAVLASEAARVKVMSRTPMGRLGEPDEIASVAVFLASEDASYVTGQTIYADGGRLPLNYTVPVAPAT